MNKVADISVFDEFGQTLLLAEVRTPDSPTIPEWAAAARKDITRRMKGVVPPYFLVVSRDNSYLWTSPAAPETAWDIQISTEDLLSDYLRPIDSTARSAARSALCDPRPRCNFPRYTPFPQSVIALRIISAA